MANSRKDIQTESSTSAHSEVFDHLPEDIWLKVIDTFGPEIDTSGHGYFEPNHATASATLRALTLACKDLSQLSQSALFRHAVPSRIKQDPADVLYDESALESLYDILLHGRECLRTAVRSIALDLSLKVDYRTLLAKLPNLKQVELTLSVVPALVPFRHDLAAFFLLLPHLTHIKISMPKDVRTYLTTSGPVFTCIPRDFPGHLAVDCKLLRDGDQGVPYGPLFPQLSSLSLHNQHLGGNSLACLVGRKEPYQLQSFALTQFFTYSETLDQLFLRLGETLQELTLLGQIIGSFPIERFSALRKLTLSGDMLSDSMAGGGAWSETGQFTLLSPNNPAGRLPKTLEHLRIERPWQDVFEVVGEVVLPRLHRLSQLEIVVESAFPAFGSPGTGRWEVLSALQVELNAVPEGARGVEEEAFQLQRLMSQAENLDEDCEKKGIITCPGNFRQDLLDIRDKLERSWLEKTRAGWK